MRRATINDVAERAGVSSATVSRVLNHNYPVAQATRDRVELAIRELGYVINAHARALAGTSNRTVGIIVQDLVDPFFSLIARGVEREASESGRLCMVSSTRGDPERELAFVDLLHEQRADMVILVGGAHSDRSHSKELAKRARDLHAGGSRLVLCGRPSIGQDVPTVSVEYDNEGGAFAITDHLLTQGHERILYLGGPPNLSTTRDRLAGHRRALDMRGAGHVPELVHTGAFSPAFGHHRLSEILRSTLEFSAVFAANDMVAIGALQALEEAGVRVPDDISLVGYDDVPAALPLRPRLTTVHVPLEEMGRQSVRLASPGEGDGWRPAGEGAVKLGTHIVVRDSVRARGPRGSGR
ncbi:LacI family DNA-binding transcriptional regulator [Streptomyces tsukubensis]|uniref:LacI family transcriptional regulator n=1 Tax=Streptomyces tsukubensis TaxID=83656 RepID=A0A1V4A9I9_9ACTN|nr:LacI family DNA-binding transcriptional regulator [Streptomyces tsukubensis]OON80166.1 LacI family transcriptional regulator [Streptomyces tsukubensis]QFR97280.1 LacI family DNA-binding transcriptional regulator [Streptomyces tsukubensis]